MSWSILQDVPNPHIDANGDPYSGAVLKAYLPGTPTSTSIAIDSVGSSLQASITYNAEGKLEVSGNEILPFINKTVKWGIFANSTDAAANTPFQMGPFDNIKPLNPGESIEVSTLADAIANVSAVENQIVQITDRCSGQFTYKTGQTPDTFRIIAADATGLDLVLDEKSTIVDQFGATGDGAADDQPAIQFALDYAETIGGQDVILNSAKSYGLGSAITIGQTGQETLLIGTGGKNGATLKALSAFTGGMIIIIAGGPVGVNFTGFNKATSGHAAITLGNGSFTNPTVTIDSVLNNGGFYDFIKTIYEYDRAILNRITSEVEIGHAVMDLQTGGSFAHAASPSFTKFSFRNPDITRAVGDPKKFGIILKRSESAKISGVMSNFDNGLLLDSENRETDITNLVTLDLRSTGANNLWESEWAASQVLGTSVYRRPTATKANGHFYLVTTGGTTDSAEPVWPTSDGGTVVDGTVTWTEVGESVNISVGSNQQVKLSAVRSEDAIVALKNVSNANIEISSSRFVGESSAILNVSGNASSMQMDNCLTAGDINLTKFGGGGSISFAGTLNNIQSDTIGDVPSHKGGTEPSDFVFGNTSFAAGNGVAFTGLTPVDATATQLFARYEDDNNSATAWVPTVTGQTNTANPAITSAYYTIIGNRCFCGIVGTTDITADDTQSDFKFTLPVDMHSATLSDIAGTIQLTTGNADKAICTVISNTGGNTIDAAVSIPKKSIAASGDASTSLVFAGNFSYKIL